MRRHPYTDAAAGCGLPGVRSSVLLSIAAAAVPANAQSFLGTIRGTVTDPQGAAVAGRRRPDRRRGDGRAPHRRDRRRGPLRGDQPAARHLPRRGRDHDLQEVRADRRGRAGPAASPAWTSSSSSAAIAETVTVSAEAANNIALESQAVSRGLDEQQLRDLPAEQPRHPGLPAAEPERARRQRRHPVPGRPDLRRLLRPGRPGLDERDLRHRRQLRPRPRRHLRDPGALELLQRRVRRARRRGRHHEARRQQLPRLARSTTSTATA